MAEPWTAGGWLVLVFVAGCLLVNVLWRVAERLLGVNRPARECSAWLEQVRRVLVDLIEVDIDKHTAQARLAKLMGSQPPEYDGLAREAFARTLLLSPALAAKAEQVGMYPPGTFARMGVQSYREYDPLCERQAGGNGGGLHDAAFSSQETVFVGTVQVPRERRSNGSAN